MQGSNFTLRETQLWLLEHLGTEPRRMKSLVAEAEKVGISESRLKSASRRLPVLRRPSGLRGPWVWYLPDDDQQVPVKYSCPLAECSAREGWMPFGLSRPLFDVGLLSYQIRGRVQRTRPPETQGNLLELKNE